MEGSDDKGIGASKEGLMIDKIGMKVTTLVHHDSDGGIETYVFSHFSKAMKAVKERWQDPPEGSDSSYRKWDQSWEGTMGGIFYFEETDYNSNSFHVEEQSIIEGV